MEKHPSIRNALQNLSKHFSNIFTLENEILLEMKNHLLMFICSGSTAVFVYKGAGPTAVNDTSLGIEHTLASGMEGMFSTRLDGRNVLMYLIFILNFFI